MKITDLPELPLKWWPASKRTDPVLAVRRAQDMMARRYKGETLAVIGAAHRLSSQRVRQIITAYWHRYKAAGIMLPPMP